MYNKRYFSQAQVESDQKDIIIAQLKADIFELRKNDDDYHQLKDQLRKLEHKYKIANEEKLISDDEFRGRHDNNLRNISQFKNDCDSLSYEINQKNKEIQDINQDNHTLKQLCDQRAQEISRIKHQIEFEMGKQDQYGEELSSIKEQEELIKNDRRNLLIQLDDLQLNIDEMHKKHQHYESQKDQAENQQQRITRQIQVQEEDNRRVESDIRGRDGDIDILEKRNSELRKKIRELEQDVQSSNNDHQKNQNETRHFQIVMENEIARNQELDQRINNLEGLLRNKEKHLDELKSDIEEIHKENQQVEESNRTNNTDLQACQKHRQTLKQANEELLVKLHKYCDQDDQVREILNRRNKLSNYSVKQNIKEPARMAQSLGGQNNMRLSRRTSPNKAYQSYYE